MKQFKIGDRVVAIKETDWRRRTAIIYGHGEIIDTKIPPRDAYGYASQLALENKHLAFEIKIDDNIVENDTVYSTECLIFSEEMFNEAYGDMRVRLQSIATDRYRYWEKIKKEKEGELP